MGPKLFTSVRQGHRDRCQVDDSFNGAEVFDLGITGSDRPAAPAHRCFNGAGVYNPGETRETLLSIRAYEGFNGAEVVYLGVMNRQRLGLGRSGASMRPGFLTPVRQDLIDLPDRDSVASMGPEFGTPVRPRILEKPFDHIVASMGPRFTTSVRLPNTAKAARSSGFNGAEVIHLGVTGIFQRIGGRTMSFNWAEVIHLGVTLFLTRSRPAYSCFNGAEVLNLGETGRRSGGLLGHQIQWGRSLELR